MFKEESIAKQEKDRQALIPSELTQSEEDDVKQLAQAEAAASRSKTTEEILHPNTASNTKSWWTNMGFWSKDERPSAPTAFPAESKQSSQESASTRK
ncbi:hypothetical protein BP6252_03483 [Coleophoma cylindrospora]|uniref:Uncharacterized protein n=1 Tax=Coleophoma cylindrospora TaxID=1849047 RepID=A0A3D8S8C2_9HELO|nr:hypothetical protein BP6252_03483 [Coleophoma cylindrospora]